MSDEKDRGTTDRDRDADEANVAESKAAEANVVENSAESVAEASVEAPKVAEVSSEATPADTTPPPRPAPSPEPAAAVPPPQSPPVQPAYEVPPTMTAIPVAQPSRSAATPIAWLALLLVLAVAAGGFWLFTDGQRRESELLQRVQSLESVSTQDVTTFDQMRDNLQRQIELEIEGMQARQQRADEDQRRASARLETLVSDAANANRREMSEQLGALQRGLREQEQALRNQQQRISDLTVEDRESWQLAEVQYLLRLANQRLIMTGDTLSAEALLRSGDNILRELDDADLHNLRSAVANDLAAVRAVPVLDTQGLYLRLDALIQQTNDLVMFELPEREARVAPPPAEDWKERLAQGYNAALEKLSEYIVVSRRDVPVETLMDPQYEGLVRQNMRMLLEQAQVAMLSGNELLFRQSLERAQGWVAQFFKADEQAAVAMAQELRAIADERVSVTLPDLSASLQALDAAMQARLARNGA